MKDLADSRAYVVAVMPPSIIDRTLGASFSRNVKSPLATFNPVDFQSSMIIIRTAYNFSADDID
jgi:hypothetical protein